MGDVRGELSGRYSRMLEPGSCLRRVFAFALSHGIVETDIASLQ